MTRRVLIIAAVLLAAALASCGGQDPAATPAAPSSSIPEELTGIWEARIPEDQLPVRTDGPASVWTLKFLGTGGEHNGPSVFLFNDRAGEFAAPISAAGQKITLGCQRYRFEVARDKLFLLPDAAAGGCPSTTIGTVLAPRGWTRTSTLR